MNRYVTKLSEFCFYHFDTDWKPYIWYTMYNLVMPFNICLIIKDCVVSLISLHFNAKPKAATYNFAVEGEYDLFAKYAIKFAICQTGGGDIGDMLCIERNSLNDFSPFSCDFQMFCARNASNIAFVSSTKGYRILQELDMGKARQMAPTS